MKDDKPSRITRGNDAMFSLLNSPDKKIDESRNFLTLLFRKLLMDLRINQRTFIPRLINWSKHKPTDNAVATSNLSRSLSSDTITPDAFLEFLKLLRVTECQIDITLKFEDNPTFHRSSVTFKNNLPQDKEIETEADLTGHVPKQGD